MRCKQGDLAIVVKSTVGNEGKVVTCKRLATKAEILERWYGWKNEPMWVVDGLLKSTDGTLDNLIFDSYLRPIRDNDGIDETLVWKSVPALPIKERV